MLQFERGKSVTLYTNFLTIENKEAVTIVDPKITIRHIDSNNNTIVDINEAPLIFAIETLYYFKWLVPSNADLGIYTFEYEGIIDNEVAEANEQFEIVSSTTNAVCSDQYTTTDLVASYLNVDVSSIKLEWVEWASRYIDFYTSKSFCTLQKTEKIDIKNRRTDTIFLENYPIITIVEIKDDNIVLDLNGIIIYHGEGFIRLDEENSIVQSFFTKGSQKVSIIYKYGFGTVPKEIEWAATVLTASIGATALTQSGTLSQGVLTEEQIGDYRREFSSDGGNGLSISNIEKSKLVSGRLEEDVLSVKNVLKLYRSKGVQAV